MFPDCFTPTVYLSQNHSFVITFSVIQCNMSQYKRMLKSNITCLWNNCLIWSYYTMNILTATFTAVTNAEHFFWHIVWIFVNYFTATHNSGWKQRRNILKIEWITSFYIYKRIEDFSEFTLLSWKSIQLKPSCSMWTDIWLDRQT
jgi:hypothetical protein